MKINKVFTLFLALFITVNSCSLVYSMPQDFADNNYETQINMLTYLDLWAVDSDGGINSDEVITKAEFIAMVLKMIGMNPTDIPQKQPFFDVTELHMYAAFISAAREMGIVNGSNGKLEPDKPIGLLDACCILTRVLNYSDIADYKGGYPLGYLSLANELKLSSRISTSAKEITRGMAAQLIFNALDANVMKKVNVGKEVKYEVVEEKTLLNSMYDVYKVNGIITANDLLSLPAGDGVGQGKIKIGSELYNVGLSDANQYIGYKVSAYFIDKSDEYEIITFTAEKNDNLVINLLDVNYYKNHEIEYVLNDKNETADIDEYGSTLLNNEIYNMMPEGLDTTDMTGFAELIDNDRDGDYDIVKIANYKHIVVKGVELNDRIIYNKISSTDKLDLGEYDRSLILNKDKKPFKLEDIKEDMVIAYASRIDRRYVEVLAFNNTDEIVVNEIARDGYNRLLIRNAEGKEYSIANSLYSENDKFFELSKKYKVALNIYNEIIYIYNANDTLLQYGYLVKTGEPEGLAYAGSYLFKIYSVSERDLLTVKSAKRVEFIHPKSEDITDPESLYQINEMLSGVELNDMLNKSGLIKSLIKFRLNNDGELAGIEIANKNRFSDGFREVGVIGTRLKYTNGSSTIGGVIRLSDQTKVLMVPEDDKLDEPLEYSLTTKAYFVNEVWYENLTAYGSSTDSNDAEMIMVKSGVSSDDSANPVMIVESIRDAFDKDFGVIKKVYGYTGSNSKLTGYNLKSESILQYKYTPGRPDILPAPEDKTKALSPGDVVLLKLDPQGRAIQIVPVFVPEGNVLASNAMLPSAAGYVQAYNSAMYGTVYARKGKCIYIKHDNDKVDSTPDIISSEMFILGDSIYVYDFANKKNPVSTASSNEIITYIEDPIKATKALVSLNGGKIRFVVVFKNMPINN